MVRPTRRPTGDTRVQLDGTANTDSFYITTNKLESPAAERCARLAHRIQCLPALQPRVGAV